VPDRRTPARHELPEIDSAAFEAARAVDRLLDEARQVGDAGPTADSRATAADRWAGYFQRLPDQLRDDPVPQLKAAARRVRAAYGPRDSVRDTLAPSVTEPVLVSIDRLLKVIARREADRGGT